MKREINTSQLAFKILFSGGETVIRFHVKGQGGAEPCGKLLTESEKDHILIDNKSSHLCRARRSLSGKQEVHNWFINAEKKKSLLPV